MSLCDFLPPRRDRSWDYARQAGVTHAIARCHPRDTGLNPPWDIDALRTVQRNFAAAGIKLIGRSQLDGRTKPGAQPRP